MQPSSFDEAIHWLKRRAENFQALLMMIMFLSFMLQIGFRYALNLPLGWTDELCVLAWVWGVLWGTAFVTHKGDDIRFDMVYGLMPRPVQKAFTLLANAALVTILAISVPATWSYVRFMQVEKTAAMGIRFDIAFSVYLVFVFALILRYLLQMRDVVTGTYFIADPEALPGADT